METVTFRNPRITAFVPPALFLLNILLNRLLEIPKMMPGFEWIYRWGKIFSLIGVFFFGCVLFPIMSFSYFAHKGEFTKNKAIIYVLVAFSPIIYVVLATVLS